MKALRDVDAELNGVKLKAGTQVDAALEDRIVFRNDTELDLNDLRRRARALGGRFQLKASKSEYLVSNNPSRLEADDILLSPGTSGDVLLKIFCDYDRRVGQLEVIEADRPIMVGDTVVRTTAPLRTETPFESTSANFCDAIFRNESSRKSAISFALSRRTKSRTDLARARLVSRESPLASRVASSFA